MAYTEKDIKLEHYGEKKKKSRFVTLDGEYKTEADSQGYSYWYDKNGRPEYNHRGYDYVFAVEDGLKDAVITLNRNLK